MREKAFAVPGYRRDYVYLDYAVNGPARYLPFGELYRPVSRTYDNVYHRSDLKYTGKPDQSEVRLTCVGARFLDHVKPPRFTSPDPSLSTHFDLTNPQSFNQYSYVLNNPLRFIDPTGMWTEPIDSPQLRGWYGSSWDSDKSKFVKVRDNKTKYHQGVDIYAKTGSEVKSALEGTVVVVDTDHEDFGKQVIVKSKLNGEDVWLRYSHLSKIDVEKDATVKEGAKIGETGKTGNASDLLDKEAHLHFEIMKMLNPGTGSEGNKNRIDPDDEIDFSTPDKSSQTGN